MVDEGIELMGTAIVAHWSSTRPERESVRQRTTSGGGSSADHDAELTPVGPFGYVLHTPRFIVVLLEV
jgi:hypothetical protein